MWAECFFEKYLFEALEAEFGDPGADKFITAYKGAKKYLCENIYPEIVRAAPDLTRHDESHIVAVMGRIADLILPPNGGNTTELRSLELYVLAMATLFHDVGNIDGREGHQSAPSLTDIFDSARGTAPDIRRERTVVLAAVKAHGGKSYDGSNDTLKDVGNYEVLYSQTVSLKEISAILRFADELAEGPERTSEFCRKNGRYAESSQLYHDYASVTHIAVDKPNNRILLNYEIEISEGCSNECNPNDEGCPSPDRWTPWCSELVEFIFIRVHKLDEERRYARYHSKDLAPFLITEVSVNFHWHSTRILLNKLRPNPIRIDEKVIPGEGPIDTILGNFPAYETNALLSAVNEGIKRMEEL